MSREPIWTLPPGGGGGGVSFPNSADLRVDPHPSAALTAGCPETAVGARHRERGSALHMARPRVKWAVRRREGCLWQAHRAPHTTQTHFRGKMRYGQCTPTWARGQTSLPYLCTHTRARAHTRTHTNYGYIWPPSVLAHNGAAHHAEGEPWQDDFWHGCQRWRPFWLDDMHPILRCGEPSIKTEPAACVSTGAPLSQSLVI